MKKINNNAVNSDESVLPKGNSMIESKQNEVLIDKLIIELQKSHLKLMESHSRLLSEHLELIGLHFKLKEKVDMLIYYVVMVSVGGLLVLFFSNI